MYVAYKIIENMSFTNNLSVGVAESRKEGIEGCYYYRRKFSKKGCKNRERAPSRINVKKIHSLFSKNRRVKEKIKRYINSDIPRSSIIQKCVYAIFRLDILNHRANTSLVKMKYRVNLCDKHCYSEMFFFLLIEVKHRRQ